MNMTRDEILNCPDLRIKRINAPGWGEVAIKEMDVEKRLHFLSEFERIKTLCADGNLGLKEAQELFAMTATLVLCDEAGNLLFAETDIPALSRKSSRSLEFIYTASLALVSAKEGDMVTAEKNSEAATISDLSTSSQKSLE